MIQAIEDLDYPRVRNGSIKVKIRVEVEQTQLFSKFAWTDPGRQRCH